MSNSLNLFKVLSGVSKTLNIAKNVIPIYKDTKPLVTNVKNIYKSFRNNGVKLKDYTDNSKVSSNNFLSTLNNKFSSSKQVSSVSINNDTNKSTIKQSNPSFFL